METKTSVEVVGSQWNNKRILVKGDYISNCSSCQVTLSVFLLFYLAFSGVFEQLGARSCPVLIGILRSSNSVTLVAFSWGLSFF